MINNLMQIIELVQQTYHVCAHGRGPKRRPSHYVGPDGKTSCGKELEEGDFVIACGFLANDVSCEECRRINQMPDNLSTRRDLMHSAVDAIIDAENIFLTLWICRLAGRSFEIDQTRLEKLANDYKFYREYFELSMKANYDRIAEHVGEIAWPEELAVEEKSDN